MKNIREVLEKIYKNPELRKKIVPLFIGNPGLGKTAIIEEFAKEKGVKLVELITSQMSPFEISGICIPDKDTKQMMYYNLDKLENLNDGDILFFDELLNGNPIVLNACLTILEQRRFISGKDLPDIMIVAAANEQGMVPLTPQIKRRFVWYPVKFDQNMWVDYMVKKHSITKSIGNKLSSLIKKEDFIGNNFNTPADLDKSVAMIIKDVPTPYNDLILPILSEPIKNELSEPIKLSEDRNLEPNEVISWLEIIKLKLEVSVLNKVKVAKKSSLPKKWFIKVTNDNFDEINPYYQNKYKLNWSKMPGFALSDEGKYGHWVASYVTMETEFSDYKEITFEEFKEHVLNK
jgi:hypothetical protein